MTHLAHRRVRRTEAVVAFMPDAVAAPENRLGAVSGVVKLID
jgi:hypothetical protein